ncbi:MAG: ATP-binding cassette domain-containing protein [Umezawaea sp.]
MTTQHVQAIHVQGLKKSYGDLHVLRGVDFAVARGSIFALLGSNGAGKTTVVRILSTLLKADAGTAGVGGFDVIAQPAAVREVCSLIGQFAAVDEILSGRENLVLIAKLRHLKHPGKIADDLLERFSLTDAAARRVSTYAGGMRRRLDIAYVTYMLPGILLITIASGVAYTALRLFTDLKSGIFERFQSMPIARSSVLWAHVLTSLVANLISLVLVVGVALLMGFRSGAGVLAWLAITGILFLSTLALTWIAVIAGLSAKTAEGGSAFSYPLIFLPFLSSAFVPTQTMPGPVRWFAENQPVTSIVNAIRDLFTQQPVDTDIWLALGWCAGTLIAAHIFAAVAYRRRIS